MNILASLGSVPRCTCNVAKTIRYGKKIGRANNVAEARGSRTAFTLASLKWIWIPMWLRRIKEAVLCWWPNRSILNYLALALSAAQQLVSPPLPHPSPRAPPSAFLSLAGFWKSAEGLQDICDSLKFRCGEDCEGNQSCLKLKCFAS